MRKYLLTKLQAMGCSQKSMLIVSSSLPLLSYFLPNAAHAYKLVSSFDLNPTIKIGLFFLLVIPAAKYTYDTTSDTWSDGIKKILAANRTATAISLALFGKDNPSQMPPEIQNKVLGLLTNGNEKLAKKLCDKANEIVMKK